MTRVTIYMSVEEIEPALQEPLNELGTQLGIENAHVFCGGTALGAMNAFISSCLGAGANVTGITQISVAKHCRKDLRDVIIATDLNNRKEELYESSNIHILTLGGIGSLEEFFYTVARSRLENKNLALIVFNSGGYYDGLVEQLRTMDRNNFLTETSKANIKICNSVTEVMQFIR